jgi:hypothetical protein
VQVVAVIGRVDAVDIGEEVAVPVQDLRPLRQARVFSDSVVNLSLRS